MRSLKPAPRVVLFVSCLSLSSYAQPAEDLHQKWEKCVQDCRLPTAHVPGRLRMLTGRAAKEPHQDSGYYFKVGEAIGHSMRTMDTPRDRLDILEIPTCQTSCNLVGLLLGKAELALVQSDVAHDAWFGHPPVASKPANDLRLVAQLYVEAVHVLVRPHLSVATLKDLRGRRVWLGPKDSFTGLTARRMLDASGLSREDVNALDEQCPGPCYLGHPPATCKKKVMELDSTEAMDKLANLEIDAAFLVGPIPLDQARDALVPNNVLTPNLEQCEAVRRARKEDPTLSDREIHLFNLDVDLVNRLVRDGSYVEQLIGADVYCQQSPSLTVGVRALLLTNQQADLPEIRTLTNTLFKSPERFEAELEKQVKAEQKKHHDPETGLPSKLGLLRVEVPDSLVLRQIEHKGHPFPWVRMEVLFLAGGFVALVAVLHFGRRKVGPRLARRGELVIGLLGLFGAWVAAALLLWNCERNVNASYATFPDAMLSTLLGLRPGGDQPVTASGQQYWTLTRWIGGFVFGGLVVTQIRDWVGRGIQMAQAWLLGWGMPRRGHAIILNDCPKEREGWIRGLPGNPLKQGEAIVIVAQTPVELPETAEYRAVSVLQGDPSSEKSLRA